MAEFLAGYSGLLDASSFIFVLASLAGFALTSSFSKASLTIVADLAYPVGLLGSLLGWVIMLTNLSDPQAVGPALAISFLTVLYAAVIHGLASGRSRDLSGIGAFIDLSAVVLFVLSVLFFVIFDRVSGDTSKNGWGVRFLGIGLLGFFIGIIMMFANIDNPKAIGPAVALAFLSLMYALFLLCMGRIWFPSETLDSEQNIKTGFLSLAFPVLTWSMIIFGVMMMSFM